MDEGQCRLARTSSFTHNGQLFALLSVDGRLRIWDVASGKLIQELSPSSTVESTCTCLSWSRSSRSKEKHKKEPNATCHQQVNNACEASLDFPALVIGMKSGSVFSYDPVSGEFNTCFKEKHGQRINCISYLESNDNFYTCSNDQHIMEWSYESGEVLSKWKGDKMPVQMICIGPKGETLVSAGNSIKLWNLKTKDLLLRFHGHLSPVSLLQFLSSSACVSDSIGADGYYILSGSVGERVISVWHVNISNPNEQAIATYRLSDVPLFMDSMYLDDFQPLKLCVGCQDGRIHFFCNCLKGKTHRPIEAVKTLDISQNKGNNSTVDAKPFLNARLENPTNFALLLVSGPCLRPSFKRYVFSELETNGKIVEKISKNLLMNGSVDVTENPIEYPKVTYKTKHVGGTNTMTPLLNGLRRDIVIDVNANEEDRQKTDTEEELVSMAERINDQSILSEPPKKMKKRSGAKSAVGSFSQMLTQALHSSDDVLLNEILFKSYPEKVLRNTIKRIPVAQIGNLVKIVIDKLLRNPSRSADLSSWLKLTMGIHLTHILSNATLSASLGVLYQLLKAQEEVHSQLVNVQGKIDLLFSHAVNNKISSDEEETDSAAAVFNDESEDEAAPLFGKPVSSDFEASIGKNIKDESETQGESDQDANDIDLESTDDDTNGQL